jgi:hypothetical protein
MELQNFISQTLTEIQRGVQSAIDATVGEKGAINPLIGEMDELSDKHIHKVSFDIAVTVSEINSSKKEGGIKVVGINLGAEGDKQMESSHVSRINFSIPIIPPVHRIIKNKKSNVIVENIER